MSSAQNVVGVMNYMTKSTAATSVSFTGNLKTDAKASGFDDILNAVGQSQTKQTKPDVASSKDVKNDSLDNKAVSKDEKIKDTTKTNLKSETNKNPVKANETNGKEANKELQNAIEQDGKKLIEEIAEMTETSEDEIIAVMEMLGLGVIDLLNPENIIQVVNALDTSSEGMNLIVDSELYSSLQDILGDVNEMNEELIREFDISPEDIENTVNMMKDKAPELTVNEEPEIKADIKETVTTTDEQITKTVDPQAEMIARADESAENSILNAAVSEMENSDTGSGKDKQGSNLFKNQETVNPFNQIVNNIVDAAVSAENTSGITYTDRAQMEEIVRQITDKITVMTSENETSMELSLHPASLGNVNILLTSSKDGITAKFTAQNEIVKEAVESQMTALMQKFDEQGVKVTSVEITIASHAFEQNLQQEDQNQEARDQMEKNKKSLRRINLAEIDEEIEEEMSQAELIAAQMMAYNGNMIDFSA